MVCFFAQRSRLGQIEEEVQSTEAAIAHVRRTSVKCEICTHSRFSTTAADRTVPRKGADLSTAAAVCAVVVVVHDLCG